MTYNFKNKQEQERIYQYWNHNQTGEPICFVIDKFFKDVEEFTFVELGCQLMGLSDLVLHEFNNSKVLSIDIINQNQKIFNKLKKKFSNRFDLILESSLDSFNRFADESIDFLYIDTDPHKETQLKEEIKKWFPKIKNGGILAFHDYDHPWHPDVKKVVDEFCKKNNFELFVLNYYNVYLQKSYDK